MITNPNWLKPKGKTNFHQISLYCIEILSDEIDDIYFLDFAIENFDELFSYIINGHLNIRIHRGITGEMWFGVDKK